MTQQSAPTLWVIQSRYLKSGDDLAAVTPRHREWLDQHYRSGLFLTSGRKLDGTGGVLLAQAESQEQLEAIFRDDPFVLEGCSEYSYTPFTPVKRGRALTLEGVALVERVARRDEQGQPMNEELGHYQSRAVRALVLIHDQSMREFLTTWKEARAQGIQLPATDSEDYKSLDHLLRHVFEWCGKYITGICELLELPDSHIPPAPEPSMIAANADSYLEDLLAHWRLPLAGVVDADMEPEIYIP